MRKYRLRKWVEWLLGIIAFLSFVFMGSDCDDLNVFILVHLIATGIFILSVGLLAKYER